MKRFSILGQKSMPHLHLGSSYYSTASLSSLLKEKYMFITFIVRVVLDLAMYVGGHHKDRTHATNLSCSVSDLLIIWGLIVELLSL